MYTGPHSPHNHGSDHRRPEAGGHQRLNLPHALQTSFRNHPFTADV